MMNRLGLFGSQSPFMSSAFSPASSSNASDVNTTMNSMQSSRAGGPQVDLMEQMQWMQSLLGGPTQGGQSSASPFMGSGFPFAVPSSSTPAAPPVDPEVTFASQLTQLQDMGFSDRDKNKRALLAAGGNVQAAISYMLDRL
jgi:ubiquilin